MAKPSASSLTCSNPACARAHAGPVPFCPFCGSAQALATPPPVPPPQTKTQTDPPAVPVPVPAPPPVPAPASEAPAESSNSGSDTAQNTLADTVPTPPRASAGKKRRGAASDNTPPAPPVAPAAPRDAAPASPAKRNNGCLSVLVGLAILVVLCVLVFSRSGESADSLDGARFEQWRNAVETCLRSDDITCAEGPLAQLRQNAPPAYWSDLQQRVQRLQEQQTQQRQDVAQADQRKREEQQAAARQQEEQRLLQEQQAAAEHAAELAVRSLQAPAAASQPDRPASLDEQSQRAAPVRYPPSPLRRGVGGAVVLNINVDAEGNATDVRVFRSSGDRALDRAAQTAAHRWRYLPAIVGGQPASGFLQKTIDFQADDRPQPSSEPSQDAAMLESARQALRSGRYDVAIALAESALQLDAGSSQARQIIQQARREREQVMSQTTIE